MPPFRIHSLPFNHLPPAKPANPILTIRNKIQLGTRIFVAFQADRPAVVDMWIVNGHYIFSFSSANFILTFKMVNHHQL